MTKIKTSTSSPDSLRQKAEDQLKKKSLVKKASFTEADTLKLLHELEVYKIELQMQNEELQTAKETASSANEKLAAVYDFAYTGYFTLSTKGVIKELNLSGARMLGIERSNLVNRNFTEFLTIDTHSDFIVFFRDVIKSDSLKSCEVRLKVKESPSIYVHLDGIASADSQNCHLTVIDITRRKRAEDILKLKNREFKIIDELLSNSDHQMSELKKEINSLLKQLGEKEKFKIEGKDQ